MVALRQAVARNRYDGVHRGGETVNGVVTVNVAKRLAVAVADGHASLHNGQGTGSEGHLVVARGDAAGHDVVRVTHRIARVVIANEAKRAGEHHVKRLGCIVISKVLGTDGEFGRLVAVRHRCVVCGQGKRLFGDNELGVVVKVVCHRVVGADARSIKIQPIGLYVTEVGAVDLKERLRRGFVGADRDRDGHKRLDIFAIGGNQRQITWRKAVAADVDVLVRVKLINRRVAVHVGDGRIVFISENEFPLRHGQGTFYKVDLVVGGSKAAYRNVVRVARRRAYGITAREAERAAERANALAVYKTFDGYVADGQGSLLLAVLHRSVFCRNGKSGFGDNEDCFFHKALRHFKDVIVVGARYDQVIGAGGKFGADVRHRNGSAGAVRLRIKPVVGNGCERRAAEVRKSGFILGNEIHSVILHFIPEGIPLVFVAVRGGLAGAVKVNCDRLRRDGRLRFFVGQGIVGVRLIRGQNVIVRVLKGLVGNDRQSDRLVFNAGICGGDALERSDLIRAVVDVPALRQRPYDRNLFCGNGNVVSRVGQSVICVDCRVRQSCGQGVIPRILKGAVRRYVDDHFFRGDTGLGGSDLNALRCGAVVNPSCRSIPNHFKRFPADDKGVGHACRGVVFKFGNRVTHRIVARCARDLRRISGIFRRSKLILDGFRAAADVAGGDGRVCIVAVGPTRDGDRKGQSRFANGELNARNEADLVVGVNVVIRKRKRADKDVVRTGLFTLFTVQRAAKDGGLVVDRAGHVISEFGVGGAVILVLPAGRGDGQGRFLNGQGAVNVHKDVVVRSRAARGDGISANRSVLRVSIFVTNLARKDVACFAKHEVIRVSHAVVCGCLAIGDGLGICGDGHQPGFNGQGSFFKRDLVVVGGQPLRDDVVRAGCPVIRVLSVVLTIKGKGAAEDAFILAVYKTGVGNAKVIMCIPPVEFLNILCRNGKRRFAHRDGQTARRVVVVGRRKLIVKRARVRNVRVSDLIESHVIAVFGLRVQIGDSLTVNSRDRRADRGALRRAGIGQRARLLDGFNGKGCIADRQSAVNVIDLVIVGSQPARRDGVSAHRSVLLVSIGIGKRTRQGQRIVVALPSAVRDAVVCGRRAIGDGLGLGGDGKRSLVHRDEEAARIFVVVGRRKLIVKHARIRNVEVVKLVQRDVRSVLRLAIHLRDILIVHGRDRIADRRPLHDAVIGQRAVLVGRHDDIKVGVLHRKRTGRKINVIVAGSQSARRDGVSANVAVLLIAVRIFHGSFQNAFVIRPLKTAVRNAVVCGNVAVSDGLGLGGYGKRRLAHRDGQAARRVVVVGRGKLVVKRARVRNVFVGDRVERHVLAVFGLGVQIGDSLIVNSRDRRADRGALRRTVVGERARLLDGFNGKGCVTHRQNAVDEIDCIVTGSKPARDNVVRRGGVALAVRARNRKAALKVVNAFAAHKAFDGSGVLSGSRIAVSDGCVSRRNGKRRFVHRDGQTARRVVVVGRRKLIV